MAKQKLEEKWCKGSVVLVKEYLQMGCVSQDSHPRKSIYSMERGKMGIESHRQILQGHMT